MINRLLVIVPAYNEQENVLNVIKEIRAVSSDYDIVVVSDGSNDETENIVIEAGVKLLAHPINLGAGAAIQTGLIYANQNNYDIAVIVDGDGQHDPKEIPNLIKIIENQNIDVAIGSRFGGRAEYKTPPARRLGIYIFSFITLLLSKERINDVTSGFRAFNKKAIKYLISEFPLDFPDAELIMLLVFSGFKIKEIPVNIRPRLNGRSMYSILRSVYYPFKVAISIFAVLMRKVLSKDYKII